MELYSKDKQYPKPLPNRIKLSDGRTRTDNSSFSKEEIEDAGYVLAPNKPDTKPWQLLFWDGNEWFLKDKNVDELKQQKMSEINSYRDDKIYSQKTVIITEEQLMPVDVRRHKPDIQNITNIIQKATLMLLRGDNDNINFKAADNKNYILTPIQAISMGEQIFAQIEQIYIQSWIKKAELEALITAQQVYEFNSSWSEI